MAEDQASEAATQVVEAELRNREKVRSRILALQAAEVVCIARCVMRLPEGSGWWGSDDRATALVGDLVAGNPDPLFSHLAEQFAVPAQDDWDPNWPTEKEERVLLPDGAQVGDAFIVGDGMGSRATVEIIERDGQLRACVTPVAGPFEPLYDDLIAQAEQLFAK